jgi:hypothetical protein
METKFAIKNIRTKEYLIRTWEESFTLDIREARYYLFDTYEEAEEVLKSLDIE